MMKNLTNEQLNKITDLMFNGVGNGPMFMIGRVKVPEETKSGDTWETSTHICTADEDIGPDDCACVTFKPKS